VIERIAALLPELRVIYLLRDPVERLWSQAAMAFARLGVTDLSRASLPELMRWLETGGPNRHSAYLANLARWEDVFGAERILVGFLDRVAEDPRGVLADVHRFLGVETGPGCMSRQAARPRNAYPHPPMPAQVARALAERYRFDLAALNARFPNEYTARWIRTNEERRKADL
jgi:hypothetical protein